MGMLAKQRNEDVNQSLFNDIFNYQLNKFTSVFLFSSLDYEAKNKFEALKSEIEGKSKMVFIVSNPDDYNRFNRNFESFEKMKEYFQKFNIKEFNLIDRNTSKFASIKHIETADIVFLMWGNPITQLAFMREYEIDKIIKDFKGTTIGVSAGAINLAKTSYCSKDDDFPETSIYDGLGIVDITVDPHFDENNKEQVNEFLNNDINIIGLPEESFIKIDRYGMKIIRGTYYIKENKKLKSLKDE